ncbi:cache domain-containing protein, partial [Pseudodesulfovibrio sp.]|nr:cache domain-containing protein [Pseudodesulfovibrio sp.]
SHHSMKYFKSIIGLSSISSFLISFSLLALLGYLWFQTEKRTMEEGYASYKTEYISTQQAMVQSEVDKVIDFIAYSKSLTEERVRHTIKSRVDEAHVLATHLYDQYKDTRSLNEIEIMVRETLRPLRFNDGRGYYFATRLDGMEMLFADRPELEGKNFLDMQDTQGKWVIKDMITIAQDKGEGFYTYTWTKPRHKGRTFPKIAFIKYFAPFDWFIGTGEYIDDMETTIQQEVLDRISEIRFGEDGYIFVTHMNGTSLSHINKALVGKSLLDATDPNGVKITHEFIRIVKEMGSGVLQYVWDKPSLGRKVDKLAYVRGFDDWQWFVGSGLYLDDLEAAMLAARERLDSRVKEDLYTIATLFLVLLLVLVTISLFLSNRLSKGVKTFDAFFARAVTSHEKIDESELSFEEFKALATRANIMVDDMAQAKLELAELNQSLENQVAERTAELENANRELIKLDEVKSTFITTVSHELRTPLTSIVGFTKLIGRDVKRHFCPLGECDTELDEKSKRIMANLQIMDDEGSRLTRLVSDILDLSKIESGKMDWRSEEVRIHECIGMAVNSLSGQLDNKPDIALEQSIAPNLPVIICDRDRLTQVIINLAGNALKFMDGGVIHIAADTNEAGDTQVMVSDNGPGISKENCTVIFDKFRQVHAGDATAKPSGTGLGLAISKQIIEHFGGTIWVKSEPGRGSCFGFTIPRT